MHQGVNLVLYTDESLVRSGPLIWEGTLCFLERSHLARRLHGGAAISMHSWAPHPVPAGEAWPPARCCVRYSVLFLTHSSVPFAQSSKSQKLPSYLKCIPHIFILILSLQNILLATSYFSFHYTLCSRCCASIFKDEEMDALSIGLSKVT